ncbi:phosphatidylinositol mannoside acyltransferase [Corynebacterium lizhenjunii]|uniref:Phosphatidylinositol mannoside acyltransferase n=1 Tax=Corynebacterium lizhenjunii TaxID=2709394 RepID=A0A7T0KCH3_9CORY|nr:phosphatidylinositol mannoside acyltransferase [Corynebacterium lizhenjunii]QPK78245.1 phosphatidylinositol mannoside acyltransferase [Corynebacterium lizhenjunii]
MGLRAAFDKQILVSLAYRAGWAVVRWLPRPLAHGLFRVAADVVSHGGKGPEQLRRNLARVVGPENVTRTLVRDSLRSYMRYWCEAFRLPSMHADPTLYAQLLGSVEGLEHLDRSLAQGKGVILALPHSGNWDMAGVFLVGHQGTFSTVAERLRPESLFEAFVRYRQDLGFDVVALTGGHSPFAHLEYRLRAGGVVALLAERDLTRSGVPVEFFGEPAHFAAGPAVLAARTGAALHVVHLWFAPDGWGMKVSAPVEVDSVESTTQRIADGFAANIAAHPEDWHMLQKVWSADLDPRRGKSGA